MKLSIILPAYNEENRIKPTLAALSEYLELFAPGYEIIVVNDGSEDKTRDAVREVQTPKIMLLDLPKNFGKGRAIREGAASASGDVKVYTDADLAYSPRYILEAVKLLNAGADGVAGSRAFAGGYPLYRRAFSHTFSYFAHKSFNLPYDTQCGFKAFTARAAREIFSRATADDYTFDVEVLLIAQKMGFRVDELFVVADYREGSKVRPVHDAAKMMAGLYKIYKNNSKGFYERN